MSKTVFSERVKNYLKNAGYSQKVLAREIGIDTSVLTHKLNGTGRTILTQPEIREIIKALAKLEAITCQNDALGLLAEADCPQFGVEEWKNFPLNKLSLDRHEPIYLKGYDQTTSHQKSSSKNQAGIKEAATQTLTPYLEDPSLMPNNLPKAVNSFVGRENEIKDVLEILTGFAYTRLLTLTGVGGTGKTRLALALAQKLLFNSQFSGGIFFVSLENFTLRSELINELAITLGIKDTPGKTQLESLKTYLAEIQCLLILDNFEQLVQAAPLLIELLNTSAGLKFLVTSRIPLKLSLEQEYPVKPLPLPHQAELGLSKLELNAAVALFVLRTKTVTPDFSFNEENKIAVVQICRKLDGLPLAIELAAARMRMLPPEKLLERLNLKLLSGGPRDLPARQQTLRGAIDWSYSLLTHDEQRLFSRLSIFAGGFTLEAAEAVCNAENFPGMEVFEGIESLILQNFLIRREGASGEIRYGMLQTIQEYGQGKLKEQGDYAGITESYIDFYVKLALEIEPELHSKEEGTFLKVIASEYDNFRNILSYIFRETKGNTRNVDLATKALKLVASLEEYWQARGYLTEGRRYLEGALALAGTEKDENLTESSSLAKALSALGIIYLRQGELNLAREYFEKSLKSGRASKHPTLIASTLWDLAGIWENLGNYNKARNYAEESLQVYREIGDKQGIAQATYGVGWMYFWPGDNETGRPYIEEALKLAQELGNNYLIIFATNSLALLKTYSQGDTFTAYQNSQKALALSREVDMTYGIAYSLLALGMIAFAAGEYDTSRQHLEESLTLCTQTGDKRQIFGILLYLGQVGFAKEEYVKAFQYFQESLVICREINAISYYVFVMAGLAGIGNIQFECSSNSDKSKFLVYCATMCGIIGNLLNSIAIKLREPESGYYKKALETARAYLNEDAFNSALKQGQAMELDEALDYALSLEKIIHF